MTKRPFKVLNGKPFFSNAGTSEGIKKAWETRKAGGGVQEQPARIMSFYGDPSSDDHPSNKDWIKRVEQLESEGLDRSDAQGVADAEWKRHGKFSNAGTSEGAKKAWETRKTGGGVQEQPAPGGSVPSPKETFVTKRETEHYLEGGLKKVKIPAGATLVKASNLPSDSKTKYWLKDLPKDLESNESAESYHRNIGFGFGDEDVQNSENFESASKGRGGIRVDEEFDHKNGSGKHVKLTIQNWKDGQKDIKMNLPKSVYAALSADQWQSNKEMERQFDGEDFHIKHGYEPVSQPDGIRKKYGKGSEPDIVNGLIGQSLARAKSYYTNAKNFDDGSTAQHALKAKAEDIIKEIHDKHHPDLLKAKASYVAPLGNRDYAILLNSFRDGLLKNYRYDVQDMLDEVADYASNGDPLPDELRERYEEWLDDQY